MKKFYLILAFFLLFAPLRSQLILDSLHKQSIALRKYDPEKSFRTAQKAYEIALSLESLPDQALALRNMGTACIFLEKYALGIKLLKKSLYLYEKLNDLRGISACLNNLGVLYTRVKNIDAAAYSYLQEIFVDLKLKDTASVSYGINNLAQILQLKGLYSYALPLYKLSLKLDLKYQDSLNAATTMIALANLYSELDSTQKSNYYVKQAIKIAKRYDDSLMLAHAFKIAGENFRNLRQFDSAYNYLKQSLRIDKKYGYGEGLINSYIYYAYLLADVGELDSAREYFFSAMNDCIQNNNQFLAYHSLLVYSEILYKQKQWKESINTLLNALEIAEQMGYELEKPNIYLLLSQNYTAIHEPDSANHYKQLYLLNKPAKNPTTPHSSTPNGIWLGIFVFAFVIVFFIGLWLILEILKIRKLRMTLQSPHEERH